MVLKMTENISKPFSYLWIIRDLGVKLTRSLEYKIIDETPTKNIIPLVEVIKEGNLQAYYTKLKKKYGEVWVDLPYYLGETENSYKEDIDKLVIKYTGKPQAFFNNNKPYIDVPVVSAKSPYAVPNSYADEKAIYDLLNKTDFKKIAVRIRVPRIRYDDSSTLYISFVDLIKTMRKTDILLLDVFGFEGVEPIICENIAKLKGIAKDKVIKVMLLNAFDTQIENCHNYEPVLCKKYDLDGFGDFATEERTKATGWTKNRPKIIASKIRYYVPSLHKLWFIIERSRSGYRGAKTTLMNSVYWTITSTSHHNKICMPCKEVSTNNNNNNSHPYWKRFRILHYLNCISKEESDLYYNKTAQDLDPEGYDHLVKSGVQ